MRGSVAPISDTYSEALRQLILSMLHLDPARRPTINQIMALPIISNSLMNLYTDFGKIPCRRWVNIDVNLMSVATDNFTGLA